MSALWGDDDTPAGPAALDDERILAASIMAKPELVDELAATGFDPADITNGNFRWIWFAVEEIRTTLTAGEIPWHAVDRQLQKWRADGTMPIPSLTRVQLSELYASAMPGSAGWHADQIAKAAVAARVIALGNDARLKGMSPAFDPTADVAALQSALDGVVRPDQNAQATTIGDLLAGALERAVTPPKPGERIPTGFIDLDALTTGGWAPGQMVVIGARPAMGKTTLAIGLARAASIQAGIPSLIRSLEMSSDELANGVLSSEAQIPLHHLKQGVADDEAMARAARRAPDIAAAPLHIDDQPLLTLPGLRAQVRHLVRTEGLRLVIIDYLQLMQAPRAENRQVAVSMISRGLKLMAKEFGITIIVLAQLNRGPEQRTEKRPMVSDLRESGSIEQDADIVMLLHREDAYERESPRAGEADIIVGKHRGGPVGDVTVAFQGHYSRFVDMAVT